MSQRKSRWEIPFMDGETPLFVMDFGPKHDKPYEEKDDQQEESEEYSNSITDTDSDFENSDHSMEIDSPSSSPPQTPIREAPKRKRRIIVSRKKTYSVSKELQSPPKTIRKVAVKSKPPSLPPPSTKARTNQPWLTPVELQAVPNPKDKILEYINAIPQADIEFSLRIKIGTQNVSAPNKFFPTMEEAEKYIFLRALKHINNIARDNEYPTPEEIGISKGNESRVKIIPGNPQSTKTFKKFGDFVLESIFQDADNDVQVQENQEKNNVSVWMERLGLVCLTKIESFGTTREVFITLDEQLFISKKLENSLLESQAEHFAFKEALKLLLSLRAFVTSSLSFSLCVINRRFVENEESANRSNFCTLVSDPRVNVIECISKALPIIIPKITYLLNSSLGGRFVIGVTEESLGYKIKGIPVNYLTDLRNQIKTMLQSWCPPVNEKAYLWKEIPVYTEYEVEKGKHYQDFALINEHEKEYHSDTNEWILSSMVSHGLRAMWCVVILEVPKRIPLQLYNTPVEGIYPGKWCLTSSDVLTIASNSTTIF